MVGHHIYTNVFGADPDLPETAEGDLRRLVHRQKYASFYKYQHIYLPPLYGILGLKVQQCGCLSRRYCFAAHKNCTLPWAGGRLSLQVLALNMK